MSISLSVTRNERKADRFAPVRLPSRRNDRAPATLILSASDGRAPIKKDMRAPSDES